MKTPGSFLQSACATAVQIFDWLSEQLGALFDPAEWGKRELVPITSGLEPDFHLLEVANHRIKQRMEYERFILNDFELRRELERQYGRTGWAIKVIDEILHRRREDRDYLK